VERHCYLAAGRRLESDIALPGLIEIEARGPAEITIARGDLALHLEDAERSGPTWQLAGDRLLLTVPGVARFLLTGGREVRYAPDAAAPDDGARDIPIFLIGTVLGIALHQRGDVVLHASAIRVGDRAVLFCGESGSGKSTLAAALVARGYELLADDLSAISIGADGPVVHPDGRLLKLWKVAVDRLGLLAQRGAAVRPSLQKFYVAPSRTTSDALALGAVYVLREDRAPHAAGIVANNLVDAGLLLRRHAYRPRLVRAMGQRLQYFHAAAAIGGNAGVFHFTRPKRFSAMDAGIAEIEAHWRALALLPLA
jgi:hypothetical protein